MSEEHQSRQDRLPRAQADASPKPDSRLWPGDEGGWAVAVYLLLLSEFVFPLFVVIKKFMVPALMKYFAHGVGYIRLPFP